MSPARTVIEASGAKDIRSARGCSLCSLVPTRMVADQCGAPVGPRVPLYPAWICSPIGNHSDSLIPSRMSDRAQELSMLDMYVGGPQTQWRVDKGRGGSPLVC